MVGGVGGARNTCQSENTETDEGRRNMHSSSKTLFYIPTGKNPRWLLRRSALFRDKEERSEDVACDGK